VRAKEVSIFDDTGYSGLFADDLGPLCRERGYRRAGIDNWYLFPAREYLALQAHTPDTEFVGTHVLSQVRRRKSPWEIDVLRRSARAAVNGVRSGFSQVGVGAMEYDIVMHAEWGMRESDRAQPPRRASGARDRRQPSGCQRAPRLPGAPGVGGFP
jgi:Xaa-Pro aminopeptidase